MAEYIEREAIEYPYMTMTLWGLNVETCHAYNKGVKAVKEHINSIPAADVEEVIHAHWETVEREAFWISDADIWMKSGKPTIHLMPVCSHCKTEFGTIVLDFKRCPECGAKMDGGAD